MQTTNLSLSIKLLSGLHIGAGKDLIKIGGMDSAVVKNPLTSEPYIPGSSLKGKLRCLLEQAKGVSLGGDESINNIFGVGADKNEAGGITKILVRDMEMTVDWKAKFKEFQNKGKAFFEEKIEITIDRKTGAASKGGLRTIERVPSSVQFEGKIVIRYEDDEEKNNIIEILKEAFKYLENDALGGSGSRGYGAVEIFVKNSNGELYSEKKKAEFLLSNAVTQEEFEKIKEEVKLMGFSLDELNFFSPWK